jgi:hypothetical protein
VGTSKCRFKGGGEGDWKQMCISRWGPGVVQGGSDSKVGAKDEYEEI